MKREVGVWIGHIKSMIVTEMGESEETRLESDQLRARLGGIETVDKMGDRLVATRVR